MNETANPYAAPQHSAEAASVPAGAGWVYLGFWQRVIASVADSILQAILGFILGLLVAVVVSNKESAELTATILGWILGVVFVLTFWAVRNATPGKMIYGAEIRDARTYGKPTMRQFIIRYIGYIPSSLVLGIGFIWVAFDKRKRGWHDIMAGTVVVRRGKGGGRPVTRTVRRAPAPVRAGQRPAEDMAPPADRG